LDTKRITLENDLQIAFSIRKEVFVAEQGVPLDVEFDEFDTLTGFTEHILVYYNEKPVGTGRIRRVDDLGKLERICVLQTYRKFGLGKVIIRALEEIAEEKELYQVKLHAQTQAQGFYEKIEYQTTSSVFIEDGIPHVLMMKELSK